MAARPVFERSYPDAPIAQTRLLEAGRYRVRRSMAGNAGLGGESCSPVASFRCLDVLAGPLIRGIFG